MSGLDVTRAVMSTDDGGTAEFTGNGTVVRFDYEGRMLWVKTTGITVALSLLPTSDGGCPPGPGQDDGDGAEQRRPGPCGGGRPFHTPYAA